MCLFACLKWNCLNLPNKYFIDTEISRRIGLTISPYCLAPSLCVREYAYIFMFCSLWTSCELSLSIQNIKFCCPHFQWWFAMQIIGAGNTWYHHHGDQMTTSSLYFLSKGFFSPALRADATANRSKGIEEKAEGFTEIKTQLELLYPFPSHTSSESSSSSV